MAASTTTARAGDLVTVSGVTYHDVLPMRVEPDGITWKTSQGVAKIDFADSPQSVRDAYHYDPAKASAYREAQLAANQHADAQTRQVLQENADRQRARMAAAAEAAAARGATDDAFVFRRAASPAASAATKSLGEQMADQAARQAAAALDAQGLGNGHIWSLAPHLRGQRSRVVSTDAPATQEYQAALHHAPGGFSVDAAHDSFFEPSYLTRTYNDDVARSEAYLRGVPLRP